MKEIPEELQGLYNMIEGTDSEIVFVDELPPDAIIEEEYTLGSYIISVSFFNTDDAIFYVRKLS